MIQRLNVTLFLSVCLAWFAQASYALETDKTEAIKIDADYARIAKKEHTTVFEGNVKITQGSTHITGDKVTLTLGKQNQIQKVSVEGRQAHYETQLTDKPDEPLFQAQANLITAFPQTNKVELIGDAKAWQGEDSVQGPHLIYWSNTQTIVSPRTQAGRATVVIQPNSLFKEALTKSPSSQATQETQETPETSE